MVFDASLDNFDYDLIRTHRNEIIDNIVIHRYAFEGIAQSYFLNHPELCGYFSA